MTRRTGRTEDNLQEVNKGTNEHTSLSISLDRHVLKVHGTTTSFLCRSLLLTLKEAEGMEMFRALRLKKNDSLGITHYWFL